LAETTNGSHVTWRELNLSLDPIRLQLDRIQKTTDLLLEEHIAVQARSRLRMWVLTACVAIVSALIPTVVGFIVS
jgi:hypothetical protein